MISELGKLGDRNFGQGTWDRDVWTGSRCSGGVPGGANAIRQLTDQTSRAAPWEILIASATNPTPVREELPTPRPAHHAAQNTRPARAAELDVYALYQSTLC